MNTNINIFENPQHYREELLNVKLFDLKQRKEINGKSLICVFFTAYCGVGCPFCFFHSPHTQKENNEFISRENHFSKKAVDKFIEFANDANVGYLQISGGGEPFLEFDAILKCIETIKAERIILVTSGFWAYNESNTEKYLKKLYNSLSMNPISPRLTIRVSISEYHSIKLKEKPLVNLINIFEKKYRNAKKFTLQLKFFEGDHALEKYLNEYFPGYKLSLIEDNGTDDEKYIKVMPWKYRLKLKSGYEIILGKSRIFKSNLRPNINNKKSIIESENIYDTDLQLSQKDYPSIIHNFDGKVGFDWIVEYNGNVCTWQNRVQDNLLNIYEDDYNTVVNSTLDDLLTYSYIDKGSKYRESIVNEISPRTVSLMKSVNIRDYAGTLLFADEKIRLYYNIRVIQDYLSEHKINIRNLNKLSQELVAAINVDKKMLQKMYELSEYSVLNQEFELPVCSETLHDFLELVKLGHYELNENDIEKAIKKYNDITESEKIESLDDIIIKDDMEVERRLTKRMMTRKKIKNEAKEITYYLCRHGETNWNVENRIKGQIEDLKTTFTDRGNKQIISLKNKLSEEKIEAIFSSDLHRTKETTKIINENSNLPIYYCENFRGLNMGDFQGGLMSDFLNNEVVKKAFIDYNFIIPGGESINQLNARYIKGLDIIRDNYSYDKVAIISHGAAISNIKSKISGEKYEDIDYCVIKYYNNNYTVVESGKYI